MFSRFDWSLGLVPSLACFLLGAFLPFFLVELFV